MSENGNPRTSNADLEIIGGDAEFRRWASDALAGLSPPEPVAVIHAGHWLGALDRREAPGGRTHAVKVAVSTSALSEDQHQSLLLAGALETAEAPCDLAKVVSRALARASASRRTPGSRESPAYDRNPAMLFTLDAEGTVLDVNSVGAEQLGYKPEDLVGRSVLEIVHPDSHAVARAHLRECVERRGEITRCSLIKVHRDGHPMVVEESGTLVTRGPGRGTELAIVCMDISAREAKDAVRRELEARLAQRRHGEALGTLAGGVAHELNNLLTAIRGYHGLASRTLEPGHPALDTLRRAEEAAKQATAAVSSLHALAGNGSGVKQPVDIARLIGDAGKGLRRQFGSAVQLRLEIDGASGAWVEGDALQLLQMVITVGHNARDVTPPGGEIVLSAERSEGHVRLIVVDGGRLPAGESDAEPGERAGRGLSMVRGWAAAHGGTVRVDPIVGRGTVVTIELPECAAPVGQEQPRPGGNGRALVVESNQLVRGLLGSMLHTLGYDPILSKGVADADRAMADADGPAAVIITGVWPLPADSISRWTGARPRIVVVGDAGAPSNAGAGVSVLAKPFHLATLRAALATAAPTSPGVP
ncbi:MAG: PAS domain S-box protein [Leptolyngbya sp. PLA1]|nr:PAS domain S-box protein [Leptolyngbya sp. PLA1]